MLRSMDEDANVVPSIRLGSNDGGRILIEVSLSKQGMPNTEITHIIREILEFNSQQLEVEKVVMPIGANTWHIRKTRNVRQNSELNRQPQSGSNDSLRCKRKRLLHNRSAAKHHKLYRGKAGKTKKRRAENASSENGATDKSDLSEVHSSPAITNLLSQLYPNPYDLINILGMRDNSEESGSEKPNRVERFKVRFRSEKEGSSIIESEEEAEAHVGPEARARRPNSQRRKSKGGRPQPAESPPMEPPKRDHGEQTEERRAEAAKDAYGVSKKGKLTSKISRKGPSKTCNLTQEKSEGKAGIVKREETRTVEKYAVEIPQKSESKEKRKKPTEEKPTVVEYLKLIKNMYEEEERQLQSKMDNAYNYSHTTKDVDKPKSKESQTTRKKSRRNADDRSREEAMKVGGDASARNTTEDFCGQTTPVEDDKKPGALALRRTDKHIGFSFPANNSCDVLRTDTYVFTRKQATSDPLPIEVINRNVLETNRKIDLLIRHIDNSMSWLSQSERTEALHMNSLVEKARDLSDNLQRNLRTYRRCTSFTGASQDVVPERDVVMGQSYHSLHIFPVDSGIGSVRISTETLFDDGIWWRSDIVSPSSFRNLVADARSRVTDSVMPTTSYDTSEVPEISTGSQPMLTSVEWRNELGSFNESVDQNGSFKIRRKRDASKANLFDVKSALDAEEKLETSIGLSPSSLSLSYVCFDEDNSSRRPILVHETKWNVPPAVPSFVSHLLYRDEQHFILLTPETLHVARATLFFELALANFVHILESPVRQESSVVISLHKCTSFIKRDDADVLDESGKSCKFVVLPSDVNFGTALSDEDVNLLNDEESGREIIAINRNFEWNPFPSESSTDAYEGDKPEVGKMDAFPERFRGKLERLTWLSSYESKPGDEAVRNSLRPPEKFDSAPPVVFRYVSSEGSNASMKTEVHEGDVARKLSQLFDVGLPEMEVEKTEDKKMPPKKLDNDDDDTSSTSSFKSSNDYSDVSDLTEVKQTKKKTKARSHFLDKLFHELRSFRKSLTTKRRISKRRDDRVFEELTEEKQKVDEAVAVNTMCIDEVAIPTVPRKIFKTSFRGKESVTELMIDLKDVSISEVSDISVEKRKLATDHTKISIIISKQTTAEGKDAGKEKCPSQHSLHQEEQQCLAWDKEGNEGKSDDDNDEDYVSVDSSTHSCSVENVSEKPTETDEVRDDSALPSWKQHKFDFYKKMDGAMSAFDSIAKVNGKQIFISSKYDKEFAPLRKAITDMQVRVQNVHKKSFCTSPDEFYERALRMAKMSAGYCQSCKSKTVIPKDPLGIYQRFIPRDSYWKPMTYGKHKKYYFKTTSSTNSSFYSIRSSSSDLSNKFCHLNSSSSFQANGMSTRTSLFPMGSGTSTTQSTTSHHHHHHHHLRPPIMKYQLPSFPPA